jgi:hypothetical protein
MSPSWRYVTADPDASCGRRSAAPRPPPGAALIVEGLPHRDENLALLRALAFAATCYELRLGEDALGAPERVIAARIAAACCC